MTMRLTTLLTMALFFSVACNNTENNKNTSSSKQSEEEVKITPYSDTKVELTNQEDDQKVDVEIDGKLFTSYCYADTLLKQILYPIYTEGGNFLTRGWPIDPREGEHTDHPHQRGMWLNYGDVNGLDFWGNSYAIPKEERETKKGHIEHVKIESSQSGEGEGILVTNESWKSPQGKELLAEKTTYHFIADGKVRMIDRITTLTATDTAVVFKDTKEGMFAIRYNRHLHIPSDQAETFVDAEGNETTVPPDSKEATGDYISSEGVKGEDVWSTRARWLNLFGNIEGEQVSLVICDHPLNFDYPTYWHARGYGLFSANPFGAKDFTDGKLTLDFTLPKGKSITFRYRTIISSGKQLSKEGISGYAAAFSELYY